MSKQPFNRPRILKPKNNSKTLNAEPSRSIRRAAGSILAALLILAAIAGNTILAVRQTYEQNNALRALQASSRLKQDLDNLQQTLLDENGELYTLIGTKAFYKRASYVFPLQALFALTRDARDACNRRTVCLSELDDLDGMIRLLGSRSDALYRRATEHPNTVSLGDAGFSEIDAYFYSVLEHVLEVRMQADATTDTTVSRSSKDAKSVSAALLICALTAAIMLLVLIFRNSRTAHKLRAALQQADRARAKYQRFFDEHPLPICLVDDASLSIIAANRAAQTTFGYSEAELLSMSLSDVHSPDEHVRFNAARKQHREGGSEVTHPLGVWLYQTRLGKRLSMDVYHLSLEDAGHRVTLSVMVDVTLMTIARAELFKSKQTLEYVLDHVPQGIAWKDASHRYVGGNAIYARDAGLASKQALIGLSDYDLKWGDDPDEVRFEDVGVMAGTRTWKHLERKVTAVDGSEVWISETKLPLADQSGAVIGVLRAYENISARRHAEVALRLQSRALEASINGIIIAEVRGSQHVIMFANSAFERITGYALAEVLNADCEALFCLNGEPEKWSVVRRALADNSEANATLLCTRKGGERFWNNILVAPVRDDEGKVTHHIGVMSDVSALVEYQQRLEHQARYDSLTQLPNRTLLDERLAQTISRAFESGGQVSVLFLDLDRFKEVNDSLGHRVGDALLARVAKRLQQLVRTTDLVARYGGDEFIIVAEHANTEQLVPMLDRIVAAMSEPFQMGVQELYVEASIGVSTYPQDGLDADTLIRNADAAMYLAKAHGRNGYKFYHAELNVAAAERLQLSTRLRRAVKSEMLQLAYQPQVDMTTGRIFGAEALLRWNDPDLGVVSPAAFIPVAEESGLIQVIGEWVLRTACSQAKAWLDQGLPPIRISVNVSPLQLERSDLVSVVKAALRDAQLPASSLELEVTEGALMRNADEIARTLRELRTLGVTIAIDDFGTGYSSLSYLKRFSVDRIKIDRAFVRDIGSDEEFEALTLAVIGIAKALKFDVLAEGVELDVHRQFLIAHDCIEGQGFLYSPAVTDEKLSRMLEQQSQTTIRDSAEAELEAGWANQALNEVANGGVLPHVV
ncbi:bifunctional diguanylate cyclase/phosphodiesterase [Paraburkholderia sp. DHOC27]|uniref:sensor domain-containing protein n=1 Tax=Paraburkholderia sp. DHOC27 TaxID=2303330 RepID=UPI000E3DE8A9|nr:bifunctional diguanylate cyclase/phosphodiesterase [Paraburkholderia sp. DHOC27]RFU49087.1 EAL domain-containing protein [Paraburkholderia sp. DHOC27]